MSYTVNFKTEDVIKYIENFSLNEECAFTEDDVDNFVCGVDENLPDWDYETGATKLVIIPGVEDFVIKIPFNGQYNDLNNEGEYIFDSFISGGGPNWNDYCALEVNITENARGDEFEDFILPVVKAGEWRAYPIYVQPKAEPYLEFGAHSSAKSLERVSRMKMSGEIDIERLPQEWVASCLDWLDKDEEKLKELLCFFEEIGAFDDLHGGNVGYYNGHPVLIDYAGYRD